MTPFGTLKDDRRVDAITLSDHGLTATILTYGAILQDVRLEGVPHSLTVGSNDLRDYEGALQFHGCLVAPVANRLGGASAEIAGQIYEFETNLAGQHTVHSGSAGTQRIVWVVDETSKIDATLSLLLPDGQGGFPGNRKISARFEITSGPALRLTITTSSDAPSIVNATNHSYWNLDDTANFEGHHVRITADHYLPADANHLVTGEVAAVEHTDFDFRTATRLSPAQPPLDTTFCVARDRRALTECLWLTGASGVSMRVATTEAGAHIYDGRNAGYRGIAVEMQGWPDAPNHAGFPSIEVTPDAPVVQVTEWRFSKG